MREFVYTREACLTLTISTKRPPQVRNFLAGTAKKWIAFLLAGAQKEQKAQICDNVYTKLSKFILKCSKNKSLYAIMCIHICIYAERGKTMKISNDINELNDRKMTNAFDLDVPVDDMKKETANEDNQEFEKEIIFSRKRDKLIHVRLTKEEKITAEMMANYHNLPLSAYIRALIKQDMRRNRQVNKVKEAGGNVD